MTTTPNITDLTPQALRSLVVQRYGEVATHPDGTFNFPVGRGFAEAVGYPADMLDQLPPAAVDSFAGISYLPGYLDLEPGMTVVDLGCGAGLDTLLAAGQVGPQGKVTGVDYSSDMAQLARENAVAARLTNIEIVESPVEDLPLASSSIDVLIFNGIVNLSPEKEKLVSEIARVLRPDGTVIAAEIVLTKDIPDAERATLDDWFR